jgi:hypothetical protein
MPHNKALQLTVPRFCPTNLVYTLASTAALQALRSSGPAAERRSVGQRDPRLETAGCDRLLTMRIATGKVIEGKLELDGDSLEEGATVTVLVPEPDETFELTPDEEVALEASLKQAAQGQFVDAEALLRELRQ